MDQWIVLNCKQTSFQNEQVITLLHLPPLYSLTNVLLRIPQSTYHVVFITRDFRSVEILRAGLELESVFFLLETTPVRFYHEAPSLSMFLNG